jgi:hypothetical protein
MNWYWYLYYYSLSIIFLQESDVFFDTSSTPRIRKKIQKFSLQENYESRVVWKFVTQALEREDTESASAAKHEVVP